jgi:hypothetical protein
MGRLTIILVLLGAAQGASLGRKAGQIYSVDDIHSWMVDSWMDFGGGEGGSGGSAGAGADAVSQVSAALPQLRGSTWEALTSTTTTSTATSPVSRQLHSSQSEGSEESGESGESGGCNVEVPWWVGDGETILHTNIPIY